MRRLRIIVLASVVVALLLATGCGPTPTPTLPGEGLEWEEIFSEPVSPYEETNPMMKVFVTPEQASELEEFLQLPSHLRLVSKTDFAAYFVITVFQGEKMTTGYSVEVINVRLDNNAITVYARFLTPDPRFVTGQLVTSPYYILRVKKPPELKGDFIFVLNADGEESVWQSHATL